MTDDNVDRSAEDCAVASACASRPQAGPLLRVRRRRAAAADGHLHPHRALARLHLVRHRQLRATDSDAANRLARRAGRPDEAVLPVLRQQLRWSSDPLQIHHGALLHVQQSHVGRLRKRRAQHQLREDFLRLRHAHRM